MKIRRNLPIHLRMKLAEALIEFKDNFTRSLSNMGVVILPAHKLVFLVIQANIPEEKSVCHSKAGCYSQGSIGTTDSRNY